METESNKLNTIGKAIMIVEAIQSANHPLSIKEIAEALDLNKSSLHHHVKTLTAFGYLQQDSNSRKYDIGLNLVRVGQAYLQRLDVRERGHAELEQLSKTLHETTHMLILDNDKAVYVDKVDVQRPPGTLQCTSFIGMRTHLHSTASGKVLLAQMEQSRLEERLQHLDLTRITQYTLADSKAFKAEVALTKARGYGLDLQENGLGLQCIAVPIFNLHGQCAAAISVSTLAASVSQDRLEGDILQQLQTTGMRISAAMGYHK